MSISLSQEQQIQHDLTSPLKKMRVQLGLTQAELAKLIPDKAGQKSVSQRAISAWERGEYEPELTLKQTKALCQALSISFDELADRFYT